MTKSKLISLNQLKSELAGFSQDELISLVTDMAKNCPQAKEFLTIKFADKDSVEEILEQYKQKVQNEFFPKRGFGRLNLREAKKAISDFKKISKDKIMEIDIMVFYVENCVEFTAEFGDINEKFYNSAESIYGQIIKTVNSCDKTVFDQFAERLKWVADNACKGWGFQDSMKDMYYELHWVNDDENM